MIRYSIQKFFGQVPFSLCQFSCLESLYSAACFSKRSLVAPWNGRCHFPFRLDSFVAGVILWLRKKTHAKKNITHRHRSYPTSSLGSEEWRQFLWRKHGGGKDAWPRSICASVEILRFGLFSLRRPKLRDIYFMEVSGKWKIVKV